MTHGNSTRAEELPEPKTPMWLPALGAVLFLMAGLFWALCPSSNAEAPAGAATAAPQGAAH